MSRRTQEAKGGFALLEATPEEATAQQQASDSDTLTRAKELLCELWKGGRIVAEVRFAGENALSAALHAVENPHLKKINGTDGATLATAQWFREQERNHEPF